MTGNVQTQPLWVLALCFIENAGIAFLVVRLLFRESDTRLVGALASVAGVIGVGNYANGVPLFPGLVIVWCICTAFVAAICYDVQTRRIPPIVVAPVIALLTGIDIAHGDWDAIGTGLVIGLAFFGLSWLRTKDVNSGLGDALLSGLAGLAFGFELGTIVVAIACFASAAFARNKSGGATAVFAPYLAATVGVALMIPGH